MKATLMMPDTQQPHGARSRGQVTCSSRIRRWLVYQTREVVPDLAMQHSLSYRA